MVLISSEKVFAKAVIMIFILAKKGKMAFKTPFVTRKLNYSGKILIIKTKKIIPKKTITKIIPVPFPSLYQ